VLGRRFLIDRALWLHRRFAHCRDSAAKPERVRMKIREMTFREGHRITNKAYETVQNYDRYSETNIYRYLTRNKAWTKVTIEYDSGVTIEFTKEA